MKGDKKVTENTPFISAKRRAAVSTLVFAFFSLAEFLAFYSFALVFSAYTYYYIYFAQRAFLFILLISAAVTVYKTARGVGELILHSALISVTRGIFFIPFFYLEILSNPLYDSLESFIISLLASIVAIIIHTALVALLSLIIKLVCKRGNMQKNEIAAPTKFNSPFTGTVLIISFIISVINFLVELVTAIVFLVESSGILFIGEAVYIVISLLFPIVLLVGIYFLSILITMLISKLLLNRSKKSKDE